MRKLLLTTTALATVASFTALADGPTVKGGFEWSANSLESKDTARKGSSFAVDSEIVFNFSKKTDEGLSIGYTVEFDTEAGATNTDEVSMTIEGGFGKLILGNNDGAADMHNMEAEDLMGEEAAPIQTSAIIGTDTDVSLDANDNNKITYIMKPMGNLNAGVSYESGKVGTDSRSTTSFGAKYAMNVSNAALTLAVTNAVKEGAVGTSDDEHNGVALKVVTGAMSFIAANSEKDTTGDIIKSNGIGASYKLASGTVLSGYSMSSKDTQDIGETYKNVGMEVKMEIAKGLNAIISYNDFTYTKPTTEVGGQAATTPADDSVTNTKLTLQASF